MKRVQVEKNAGLPASKFCENLLRSNNLAARGFSEWAFHPGMLFNSQEKWWGDGGRRTSPHEGIDLCLYCDGSGALHHLDSGTAVPVIFQGHVKRIIEDYLGSTLFVAHDICDSEKNQCYTIYGHVTPAPGIALGAAVSEGKIIAAIADTERKKAHIIPHLHISIAWVPENFPADQLTWESMNRRHTISLVNPLDVLNCSYSIVEQSE
jgi:murein DD-endopeptidase MepM/ murein hydrolase activator NlpD